MMQNEYIPAPGLRKALNKRQMSTYRVWLNAQKHRGRPALCFGVYWWVAHTSMMAQRARIVETCGNTRQRPDGCTTNNWRIWNRLHKQKGVTFAEYMAVRNEGVRLTTSVLPKDKRPSDDPTAIWTGWRTYQRLGGKLSYQEYLKKSERRIVSEKMREGQVKRVVNKRSKQPEVAGDDGLCAEPKTVVARIERKLAAMGLGRAG